MGLGRERGKDIQRAEGAVTKEPVLAAPDINKKMRMEVDASDYATEGVLSMEC